ncbi:MAG: prepilin-type N-terminal cleavage/methylation domain-containing protein [Lachnospiraceae bacterium]|jgi:Tfp pilus assembly protein PilE|nr:prepilin-type N-terminal cleavage/methylation domain-containing protein [Lachnospiraceae bacterium]
MKQKLRKQMKQKLRKQKKRNQKGYTLIELVVSFALTGLLLSGAGMILAQSINRHYQMNLRLDMISVSQIILDKITGELHRAKNNGHSSTFVKLAARGSTGCPSISYISCENTWTEITWTKEEGQEGLLIFIRTKSSGGEIIQDQWMFDSGLYQGCIIEDLDFVQLARKDGSPTNIIKVSLTLRHQKTGNLYSESRCVPCSQFRDAEDIGRIAAD